MCFAKYKPKESHVASLAPTSLVRPGVIMKLSIRNSQVEKVGISWGRRREYFILNAFLYTIFLPTDSS
jgi:hypothetical protein